MTEEAKFLRIPEDDSREDGFGPGSFMVVELRPDGQATREVGVSAEGVIVHRCPDDRFPDGEYGWYDYPLESTDGEPISRAEFEELWSAPVPDPPRSRTGRLLDRLRALAPKRVRPG